MSIEQVIEALATLWTYFYSALVAAAFWAAIHSAALRKGQISIRSMVALLTMIGLA